MDSVVKAPKEIRKWTKVFGATRTKGVYSMKGTRARCSRAIAGCEGHSDWLRSARMLEAAGVAEDRSGSGSPVNATTYEYTYVFLGGKFTTVGGDYWGGKHGAYVEGIKTLRFLCYRLNLTQPRRTKGEVNIPTLEELQQELAGLTDRRPLSDGAVPKPGEKHPQPIVAAENPAEPAQLDQPTVCPFCSSTTGGCEHFFALIDETFATVSGPASDIFGDLAESDPEEGVTANDVEEFITACDESCGYCWGNENEGGPGMSSQEYWCWSENVARDLAKLRQAMCKVRGVDPKS